MRCAGRCARCGPSYRELNFFQRLRVPTSEFAYRLCKVGWLWVWARCEDVKLTLGGPRHGKSVEEICRIIDAPGAVIATSTRADLYEKTHRLRAERGPVFVFNPSGIGGIATDVTFDPLTGCTEPKTAVDRAGDLIAGAASSSERRVLAGRSGALGRAGPRHPRGADACGGVGWGVDA